MDATRGLNRRWIARVSLVVVLPLISVLPVGAIEGAGVPSGSPRTIGPATRSAANSEPAYSTSLRIVRGPGEPPRDTSLRILDVISDPERLGQSRTLRSCEEGCKQNPSESTNLLLEGLLQRPIGFCRSRSRFGPL